MIQEEASLTVCLALSTIVFIYTEIVSFPAPNPHAEKVVELDTLILVGEQKSRQSQSFLYACAVRPRAHTIFASAEPHPFHACTCTHANNVLVGYLYS